MRKKGIENKQESRFYENESKLNNGNTNLIFNENLSKIFNTKQGKIWEIIKDSKIFETFSKYLVQVKKGGEIAKVMENHRDFIINISYFQFLN